MDCPLELWDPCWLHHLDQAEDRQMETWSTQDQEEMAQEQSKKKNCTKYSKRPMGNYVV